MSEDVEMREERKHREDREQREQREEREEREEQVGPFERDRTSELKGRWSQVQADFVDDPREAVKAADGLVEEVIRDLTTLFSDERTRLEQRLKSENELSTEDLRLALRRYRSFFERLLSV